MASTSVARAPAVAELAASSTGAAAANAPLPSISLRPLVAADLPQAHALSRAADWPHRPEDWAVNFAGGQGIAAVAAKEVVGVASSDSSATSSSSGEIVGVILWWKHGTALATLGMLIVSLRLQRRGVGRRLLVAALEDIDAAAASNAASTAGVSPLPVPCVRLQSSAAGAALYISLGFKDAGWVLQHQGTRMNHKSPPVPALPAGCGLRSLRWRDDAVSVCALDQRACGGGDRTKLLGHVAARSTGVALVREEDGKMLGYALCRPFGHGRVIGPVVAPNDAAACALVAHLAAPLPPGFLRLDIEEEGTPLLQGWLKAAGVLRTERVQALTRGPAVAAEAEAGGVRMFALASQATS